LAQGASRGGKERKINGPNNEQSGPQGNKAQIWRRWDWTGPINNSFGFSQSDVDLGWTFFGGHISKTRTTCLILYDILEKTSLTPQMKISVVKKNLTYGVSHNSPSKVLPTNHISPCYMFDTIRHFGKNIIDIPNENFCFEEELDLLLVTQLTIKSVANNHILPCYPQMFQPISLTLIQLPKGLEALFIKTSPSQAVTTRVYPAFCFKQNTTSVHFTNVL
jgi:hypothetical protein